MLLKAGTLIIIIFWNVRRFNTLRNLIIPAFFNAQLHSKREQYIKRFC